MTYTGNDASGIDAVAASQVAVYLNSDREGESDTMCSRLVRVTLTNESTTVTQEVKFYDYDGTNGSNSVERFSVMVPVASTVILEKDDVYGYTFVHGIYAIATAATVNVVVDVEEF